MWIMENVYIGKEGMKMGKVILFLVIALILFNLASSVSIFSMLIPVVTVLLVGAILIWVGLKLFK